MQQSLPTAGPPGTVYIGASTKMYLGYRASLRWLEQVRDIVAARPAVTRDGPVRVFVVPSFPVLESARSILDASPVWLGAQNCSWGDGPLTGEVSAGMLAELGVGLVEIGHAERRTIFAEDDTVVARKVDAALRAGLTPLLCVGERERMPPEEAARWCAGQVRSAAGDGADGARLRSMVLAYEPVWAIGAPAPADPDYVNRVVALLRAELLTGTGTDVGIVYGGSAGPGLLPRLGSVDGLFLGRFAHVPEQLGAVIDEAVAASGRA